MAWALLPKPRTTQLRFVIGLVAKLAYRARVAAHARTHALVGGDLGREDGASMAIRAAARAYFSNSSDLPTTASFGRFVQKLFEMMMSAPRRR